MRPFLNIILCGFFCAGKSSVGKLCAENLGLPFYDTDRMIEFAYGASKTRGEIWREIGSEAFRALETEVIHSLRKEEGVIATGGGALLCEANRLHLKQLGTSIYLKASVDTLYQRALQRGFPAYLDPSRPFAHFTEIANERFPLYTAHCDHEMETDHLTLEVLINKIINYIKQS